MKICSKFTGERPCWIVISAKLHIILQYLWSPVNLLPIFRTPFHKNNPYDHRKIAIIVLTILQYSTNIKIFWNLCYAWYDVPTVHLINVFVPNTFREKENMFLPLPKFLLNNKHVIKRTCDAIKLKLIASYLCLITCLLLHRNFGNIVYDIVQKCENVCMKYFNYENWKGYPSKLGKLK